MARPSRRPRGAQPEALLERVFPPMLATLVAAPPPDEARAAPRHVVELKYDGFRALGAVVSGQVALWSRNRLDLGARFPRVARALERVRAREAVLDGEIVVLDEQGVSRFQEISRTDEALYVAFDLLWLDGEDLRARPLEERRAALERLLADAPAGIRFAERLPGRAEEALAFARQRGYEGVMLKELGSRYEPRRSPRWLKLKVQAGQELVIVGFTPSTAAPAGKNAQIGALLLAVREGKAYRYAGRVGTGFTLAQRRQLRQLLEPDAIDAPSVLGGPTTRKREVTWVAPRYLAEVRFTEWTADGKLRHPAFLGLREDKSPSEATRERPRPIGHHHRPRS